jgi:hypothetical protein
MRKCLLLIPVVVLVVGCSRNPGPVAAAAATPAVTGSSGVGSVPNDASVPAPTNAATPVHPPAPETPARSAVVIPNGTAFHVRLDTELDTKHNRAGDGFTASLAEPLLVGGLSVLPKGTEFRGHVTQAGSSGRMKGRAMIGLTLDSFEHEGHRYDIRTTSVDRVSAAHKKRNAILIGGGTGLGAALGAIAGGPKGALIGAGAGAAAGTAGAAATGKRQVAVPSEAMLRFTFRRSVEL